MKKKRRPASSPRGQLIHFGSKMLNGKSSPTYVASELKKKGSLFYAVSSWGKALQHRPDLYSAIFGEPFPSSIEKLRATKQLAFTGSLERELAWSAAILETFSDELNFFVGQREAYEAAVISANYGTAWEILDLIEERLGKSLWSVEQRFVLGEAIGGLEKNKEILASISDENVVPVVAMLSEWFSKMAETGLSTEKYLYDLDKLMSTAPDKALALANYVRFKLDKSTIPDSFAIPYIVHVENKSSALDRYITFLRACQVLVSNPLVTEAQRQVVARHASHVFEKVKDRQLEILLIVLRGTADFSLGMREERFMQIADYYTSGDYEQCYKSAKAFLVDHPACIDAVTLYVKSAVSLRIEPELLFEPATCALDSLIHAYFSILSGIDDPSKGLSIIRKISQSHGETTFAHQMRSLVAEFTERDISARRQFIGALSSHMLNPQIVLSCCIGNIANNVLGAFQKSLPNSITLDFFKWYIQFNTNEARASAPSQVPVYRAEMYRARALVKLGETNLASEIYHNLSLISELPPHVMSDLELGYYFARIKEGDFRECILIASRNYLRRSPNYYRIDFRHLLDCIDGAGTSAYRDMIELSILRSAKQKADSKYVPELSAIDMANIKVEQDKDLESLFIAYQEFLFASKCTRPMDIQRIQGRLNQEALIYFLREVCVVNVVRKTLFTFRTFVEVEKERIAVCQWLAGVDPSNSIEYRREIDMLTQNIMLKQAVRTIDESRIQVNETKLRNAVRDNVRQGFLRYRALVKLNVQGLRFVDTSGAFRTLDSKLYDSDYVEVKTNFSSDTSFSLFKELFLDIRDKFLLSKVFGLDLYLSMRIRHNVLFTFLRKEFENESLITQRESNSSKYIPDRYWTAYYQLRGAEKEQLQSKLAQLSRTVDDVLRELNDHTIKIRVGDEDKLAKQGLFDYAYSDADLQEMIDTKFASISSPGEFLDEALAELWKRTEANLGIIRQHINTYVKPRLNLALDELAEGVTVEVGDANPEAFLSSITRCREGLSTALEAACKWFNLPKKNTIVFYEPELAVATALESVRNSTTSINLVPTMQHDCKVKLDGETFIHVYAIFKILLENVVMHGAVVEGVCAFELATLCEGDTLVISTKNPLHPNLTDQDKRDGLARINSGGAGAANVNEEGWSGYTKIRTIIKEELGESNYHLLAANNGNTFSVEIKFSIAGLIY